MGAGLGSAGVGLEAVALWWKRRVPSDFSGASSCTSLMQGVTTSEALYQVLDLDLPGSSEFMGRSRSRQQDHPVSEDVDICASLRSPDWARGET